MKSHTQITRQWCLISSCLHWGECKSHCKGTWLLSIPLSFSLFHSLLLSAPGSLSASLPSHDPIFPSVLLHQTLKSVTDWQKKSRARESERERETERRNGEEKPPAILMNSIWPSTPCLTRPPLPSSTRPLELWSRLQFVNVTNDLYPFLFPSFSPSFFSPAPVCPHSGPGPSNHFQSADSHLKSAAVIK